MILPRPYFVNSPYVSIFTPWFFLTSSSCNLYAVKLWNFILFLLVIYIYTLHLITCLFYPSTHYRFQQCYVHHYQHRHAPCYTLFSRQCGYKVLSTNISQSWTFHFRYVFHACVCVSVIFVLHSSIFPTANYS